MDCEGGTSTPALRRAEDMPDWARKKLKEFPQGLVTDSIRYCLIYLINESGQVAANCKEPSEMDQWRGWVRSTGVIRRPLKETPNSMSSEGQEEPLNVRSLRS